MGRWHSAILATISHYRRLPAGVGGVSFAAAFSGRPELVDFVRIAHNAIIVGWLGILVFLFGVVSGVIRLVTRKPTENRGKSQDQSAPSP
jgi:hypothetical protein